MACIFVLFVAILVFHFCLGEIKVTLVEKTIVGKLKNKKPVILSLVQQPAQHISTVSGS